MAFTAVSRRLDWHRARTTYSTPLEVHCSDLHCQKLKYGLIALSIYLISLNMRNYFCVPLILVSTEKNNNGTLQTLQSAHTVIHIQHSTLHTAQYIVDRVCVFQRNFCFHSKLVANSSSTTQIWTSQSASNPINYNAISSDCITPMHASIHAHIEFVSFRLFK